MMKRNLSSNSNVIGLHILVWLVFVIYESLIAGIAFGLWGHPLNYLIHYAINISFFYINAHILFKWALSGKSKGFFKLTFVLVSELTIYIIVNYWSDFMMIFYGIIEDKDQVVLEKHYILRILYRAIYFLSFSIAYYYLMNYIHARKIAESAEKKRLQSLVESERIKGELARANNAFLRAQINPHFLFNTLNFLYHKINENDEEVREAILSLSEMMRYVINADINKDFVLLGDEIRQLDKFLSLYQIINDIELNIDFYYSKEVCSIPFVPLVLSTLVENMCKHGNLADQSQKALILIIIDNNFLQIKTLNKIVQHSGISTKVGLKNIHDRLSYAYGEKVKFVHGADGAGNFYVEINIQLQSLILDEQLNSMMQTPYFKTD